MITQPAKLFLPLTALGLVAAVFYSAFTGDHGGITLFFGLAAVAFFGGVAVTVARDNEVAPAVAPDAERPTFRPIPAVRLPGGAGWPALAALGVGLVVLSFIQGPAFAIAGVGLGLVGAVGWLGSVAIDRTGRTPNLMPLGIPVVGLFAIGSLMFFMSRILLAVPEKASTGIALSVAILIMASASLVAVRPHVSSRALLSALVVGGVLMVGGGLVAAAAGQRHVEEHAHEPKKVDLSAKAVKFSLNEIHLTADQEAEIKFDNLDTAPHNVAIYGNADYTGRALFQGPVVTAGQKANYEFKAPPAGTYYFRCDIHPTTMKGTVIVA